MAWYNASWTYRVKVTVLATKVDADITDFPIYVDLANLPAGFHTNVKSGGVDIRVTKSDGLTELPREIVYYNNAGDVGEMHFKGDVLNASDVDFYIYYGNSSASDYAVTDPYGANNVWSSAYKGVYHLGDGTTLGLSDSTSNANNVTNTSATATTGKVKGGVDFGGSAGLTKTSPAGLLATFPVTVEFWVKAASYAAYQYMAQASYYGGATSILSIANQPGGQLYYYQNGAARLSTSALSTGVWNHIVLVFNSTTVATLYINGVADTIAQPSGGWTLGAAAIYIGRLDNSSNALTGQMDEVRYGNHILSATYVSTEYNNQNDASTFFTIGTEEENAVAATLNNIVSISNITSIII